MPARAFTGAGYPVCQVPRERVGCRGRELSDEAVRLGDRVSVAADADVRAQLRSDLARAGSAGRHPDAPGRRQRRRRGDRHGGRQDHHRAVQQRSRLRCLLHPVGREGVARPQRFGRGSGRLEPGLLPAEVRRRRAAADARLGLGHRAGRGRRLGGAERALRPAPLRRPDAARDPHRRARLPRPGRGPAEMGGRGPDRGDHPPAGLLGVLPAAGPGTGCRRAGDLPGRREDPAADRRDQGRGLLPGRDRRGDRRARAGQRRRDDRRRPRGVPPRMGHACWSGSTSLGWTWTDPRRNICRSRR